MEHHFNIKIAERYGIEEAILLSNFEYWITKNKANNQNFFDGYYWTYNSKKALTLLFPYMTDRKIDYAINNLINQGLIIKGNYNKNDFDRTLWYAITKKGYSILQNCEMDSTKLCNGVNKIVEPIPNNNNHIENTNIKERNIIIKKERLPIPPTYEEVLEYAISRDRKDLAKKFYDYYTIGDWKRQDGTPIKNWKQQFVTWEMHNKKPETTEKCEYDFSSLEI